MKTRITIFYFFSGILLSSGQSPDIQWQKSYGGAGYDNANTIEFTKDGGYIVAGFSDSSSNDVTGNHGGEDYWIVKLNATGAIQWEKSFGGKGFENATSIKQTPDDGYIIAGSADSTSGDVTGNHGGDDYWIVKIDSAGTLQWEKSYGGSGEDLAYSVQLTSDGGYIVAGYTNSTNGDVSGKHGYYDSWVIKLDGLGILKWQKCYGGSYNDVANCMNRTRDGGFIIGGYTFSNDGDVTGNHGNTDCWIVKIDSTGIIEWEKCYGGSDDDAAASIEQTSDGTYIVAGLAISNDGDVTGNHDVSYGDFWIIKLDSIGTLKWEKCFGGSNEDQPTAVHQTSDGGYVASGWTSSLDGDVSGLHGTSNVYDYWIIKIDSGGSLQWQRCLGGTGRDRSYSMQITSDKGYILAGYTRSNDGDISDSLGITDYWVVKLNSNVGVENISGFSQIKIYPNPAINNINIHSEVHSENASIYIKTIPGQFIQQIPVSWKGFEAEVNVSGLDAGVYIVEIVDSKGRRVGKFIKE